MKKFIILTMLILAINAFSQEKNDAPFISVVVNGINPQDILEKSKNSGRLEIPIDTLTQESKSQNKSYPAQKLISKILNKKSSKSTFLDIEFTDVYNENGVSCAIAKTHNKKWLLIVVCDFDEDDASNKNCLVNIYLADGGFINDRFTISGSIDEPVKYLDIIGDKSNIKLAITSYEATSSTLAEKILR